MSIIDYALGNVGGYAASYLQNLTLGTTLHYDLASDTYYTSVLSVYPTGMVELLEAAQTTNILLCLLIVFVFILTIIVIYNVMMQRFRFNR